MSHLTAICLILKLKKYCIQKVPLFKHVQNFGGKRLCKPLQVTKKLYRACRKSGWFWPWKRQPDSVQYVPILSSIKTLLHYEDVLGWIYDEQYLQTGTINKYTQGSLCQKKWSLQQFSIFLTINFVSWWFGVSNPLGNKIKKQKISVFYFVLGNIPAKYRSRLIFPSELTGKYGYESLLQPLIEDTNNWKQRVLK